MKTKELIAILKTMPQESYVGIHIGRGVHVPLSGAVIASGYAVTLFTKHEKAQNAPIAGPR